MPAQSRSHNAMETKPTLKVEVKVASIDQSSNPNSLQKGAIYVYKVEPGLQTPAVHTDSSPVGDTSYQSPPHYAEEVGSGMPAAGIAEAAEDATVQGLRRASGSCPEASGSHRWP